MGTAAVSPPKSSAPFCFPLFPTSLIANSPKMWLCLMPTRMPMSVSTSFLCSSSLPTDSSQDDLLFVWTMLIVAAAKDSEIALRAFQKYDKDGNGAITAEELRGFLAPAFRAFGEDPTICQLQQAIEDVDVDGNRTVDFNEFKNMLAILEQRN